MAQPGLQEKLASIERLIAQVESAGDPAMRASVKELLQTVMDLHGAGLERIVEITRGAGDTGAKVLEQLGRDELITSLLVLYGLHPLDLQTRLEQALDKARARLRSRGGEIELIGIHEGSVRLRLRANGGCGSTRESMEEMVEQIVYEAAPDITALVIEPPDDKQAFVPIAALQGAS